MTAPPRLHPGFNFQSFKLEVFWPRVSCVVLEMPDVIALKVSGF